jgi:regulatory protein
LDVTLLWNGTAFIGAGSDMASKTMSLRARALSFLARREHTRSELEAKLTPHLSEDDVANDALNITLDFLQSKGWLSDTRAAQAYVDTRGKRFGKRKLQFELGQKGLTEGDIEVALENVDETATCHVVWQRKFDALPQTLEEKAKQTRFLLSRGFSSAAIRQVLKGIELDDESD